MSQYVTDLRPADVLFGRGSGPNDHEGNVRFRQLVADRKAEYLATNHRMTKAKIAREIVDQVFAQQGRFLKKVEADDLREAGFPESTDIYMHVDEDTIMEKAKQALRQNTNKKSAGSSTPANAQETPSSMAQHGMMGQHPGQQNLGQQAGQHLPTTLLYGVDDLEPIPIAPPSKTVAPHPPSHLSRPSQLAMPPPAEINTAWAIEQQQVRQQRMMQLQQQQQQQQQQNLQPDPQYSAYSEQDTQAYADGKIMGYNMSSGLMEPPSQRQPSQEDLMRNEPSLYRLPSSDDTPVRNSLRGSLNVPEGFDRESMDIAQLMDSFRSTRIGDGEGRKMMSSTDTMGTIEPIAGSGSVADMSIGMNSSTFSILKGDESWQRENPTTPGNVSVSKLPPIGSSGLLVGGRGLSESSFTFSELTTSNRSSSGNNRRASATSQSLAGVKEEGNYDTDPLPVDMRVSLGSSSLSYLKGMVLSSTDDVLQQSMNSMSPQQQEQQSEYSSSYQEQQQDHHHQQQQQQKPPSY